MCLLTHHMLKNEKIDLTKHIYNNKELTLVEHSQRINCLKQFFGSFIMKMRRFDLIKQNNKE